MPNCFSRSSIKFLVHTGQKLSNFIQIGRFQTVIPVWIYWWLWYDAQSLMQHGRGALLFFKVICKFQSRTGQKNHPFWTKLSVSRLLLKFEFTHGFEIMHKAWLSKEEGPYCFSRSSVKLQGHTRKKITEFDPNWVFLDCNSSLNSPMDLKWCTKM